MAVVDCRLISNRSGEHNSQYQKTYSVQYRLLTSDPLDGPSVVVNHTELPALYDTYSFGNDSDTTVYLISKSPREESDGSFKTWVVTCEYSNRPPVELASNPLSELPKISVSMDQFTQVVRVDVDGNWVTNTTGLAFVPPPDMDMSRPVVTVMRNESFIDIVKAMDYSNTVNQSAWKGCAPRTVKCRTLNYGVVQQRSGVTYTEATYEFHLFDQTWDFFILNRSIRYKDQATSKYITMLPGEEPVTIYTGNDGSTADVIVPRGVSVTRDAVYVRKRVFKERNFNSLGLVF